MATEKSFEQGPIRPPSEAGSLLIRATRNCPWNKCAFCGTYTGRKFSRRSVDEVKADIDAARAILDDIKGMSWKSGQGGGLTRRVLSDVFRNPALNDCYRSVALWQASGGDTVFLQDANSVILSTDKLVEILNHIKEVFPGVTRITSYARANTLNAKSVDDFKRLKAAGLTRLHVGMESGSDRVLKLIDKGMTAQQIIEAGRKVVESGISLCMYIIPGIGGKELSMENALESARVVNAVNPDHVRFRSLHVRRGTKLKDMEERGEFTAPDEDEIVREIRTFVEKLDGVTTTLVSDHILNLLEEVEGTLPDDKEKILGVIDRYLGMSDEDRALFQLGRRGGALRSLDEFDNPGLRARLEAARTEIETGTGGGLREAIRQIKHRFV